MFLDVGLKFTPLYLTKPLTCYQGQGLSDLSGQGYTFKILLVYSIKTLQWLKLILWYVSLRKFTNLSCPATNYVIDLDVFITDFELELHRVLQVNIMKLICGA